MRMFDIAGHYHRTPFFGVFLLLLFSLSGVNLAVAETALEQAIQTGDLEKVRLLLEMGANRKSSNEYITLLGQSLKGNNLEITKELIETGLNVNERPRGPRISALHIAAQYGRVEAVKILVENDADINIGNHVNETPLHSALCVNRNKMLYELGGAESHTFNKGFLITIYIPNDKSVEKMPEVDKWVERNITVAKYLIDNGAKVNIVAGLEFPYGKRTVLHCAVKSRNIELIKYLLDNGANKDKKDSKGNTAAYTALNRKDFNDTDKEIVILLREFRFGLPD